MQGSVRVAQMCKDFGLTWGSHSNNHFDISLAMFTHVGAAAPGRVHRPRHALDLAGRHSASPRNRCRSRAVKSKVPDKPGWASSSTSTGSMRRTSYIWSKGLGGRDDAAGMQYLVPGWTFDNKKPALVR